MERLKYLREAFANAKLDRYPWRKVATGEWVALVTENNRALVPFYCDLSRISEPLGCFGQLPKENSSPPLDQVKAIASPAQF